MKTQTKRRDKASLTKGRAAMSTNTALPERGGRTCKVAIPEGLHGATKAVAARLGQSVQDLVARLLRLSPEITAEEKMKGGAL